MSDDDYSSVSDDSGTVESLRQFFASKFSLKSTYEEGEKFAEKAIPELSFDGLINHWKEEGFKKIVTMVGAGISTSAGIPDFRSPGSGLYDNLQKYNLPHPSAIFEMGYFHNNPQPFFALAKELYPGTFNPTPSHYFVRLLHEKGLLQRHYTQNIDTLERIAGIPNDKLVEAHGSFYTNHCLDCRKLFSMEWMKKQIFDDVVPTCDKCNSIVKPDIVFFGEDLPEKFYTLRSVDFKDCDLLIIMGTSLEVQPFASLVERVGLGCVRLLLNRTKVGHEMNSESSWYTFRPELLIDHPKNTRDVAYIGDCDDGVLALADALGWGDELRDMVKTEHERLRLEEKNSASNRSKSNEKDDVAYKSGINKTEKKKSDEV